MPSFIISVILSDEEIRFMLRRSALAKLDIGQPFNIDEAKIEFIPLPAGAYSVRITLEAK